MPAYQHTQRGILLLRIFGISITAMIVGAFFAFSSSTSTTVILGIAAVILAVAAFLFHSLHVEVTDLRVGLAFGPGWIRKSFPVSEITSANAVRNRWYYGWGIRYTPHGWLYNVSGFDAVEISMRNGKKYRIGTDEPQNLSEAIRAAIAPIASSA